MDAVLPPALTNAASGEKPRRRDRDLPFSVRAADGKSCPVELTSNGFVIRAETPPRLRGYADIFQGDRHVMRGLVVCTWARDGMVGYEFKRGGARYAAGETETPA